MTTDFGSSLPSLLDEITNDMVDRRHDLHQHPEVSFEEFRTTHVITNRLRELQWTLEDCPTPTGAIATLRTGRPGKTVMIRADIDGLPVNEERDLAYRSTNDGVMHACGHDVHTAALLGLADALARREDQLVGSYVALFQPAEEGLGGAKVMVDAGVLERLGVDYVIGAHVTSLAPVGVVATRPGVLMSEADQFMVTITGKGGHGAMATVDGNVVLAVAALAQRVGSVVTDLTFEGTNCACSAGVISAGTAHNVVPRTATLRGSLRTFSDEQRATALARLRAVLDDLSAEFAVTSALQLQSNAPRVTNNPLVTERVESSARTVVGDDYVWRIPPASPSDDMSEFLNRVPGCYIFVGGGLADGSSGMHHSPDFAVDDGAVRIMAGVLAQAAVDLAQP
jgi:amidohydrolase